MVVSNINKSIVAVNSLLVDNGSTFLCYTKFWAYENITITDSIGAVSGFGHSSIKLYGNGSLASYDGCTSDTCVIIFRDTNVTFFENSQLSLKNITTILMDLTFYNPSNSYIFISSLHTLSPVILNDESNFTVTFKWQFTIF
ncbi:hypothetical protein RB653_004314 [Dictyostelium firmibasis]|uniref:Uncharacterized protein n=1 Tax=Dictyostelium firmibasis TaxID=79012 RepID=A0AAN7TZA0_9MYCE